MLTAFFKEFKSAAPWFGMVYHKALKAVENLNENIKEFFKGKELKRILKVERSIFRDKLRVSECGRSKILDKEMRTW